MPTYRLKSGTIFRSVGEQIFLLSQRPLQAMRINHAALALLRQIEDPTQVNAANVLVESEDIHTFLKALVRRGMLLRQPAPPPVLPTVSVVIAVRNRPHDLHECLKSLLCLDYPSDRLEIIVVDDASDDDTPRVAIGLPVRLIRQSRQVGPAACRNAGASAATGEIIAYTDSDCVVDPDWLFALIPYFCDQGVGAVGGLIEPFRNRSAIDRYEAVSSSLYMGREEGEVRPNSSIPFLPTANLLVRRAIWQHIGGFDEAFPIGEDVDLVWRARDAGLQVRYVPRGRIRHKYRATLRAYVARRAFYGGSETFLLRKHRDKPKKLVLSGDKLASLGLLVAGLLTGFYPLAASSLMLPAVDFARRVARLRRFGAPVPYSWVAGAQLRDYTAYYHHLFGNFARYYSIPFLLLGLLWLPLLIGALLAMLYPVAYDFVSRRPRLSFLRFLALYWLELLAHQLGVLRRCYQCGAFGVLVPRLVFYLGIGAS